YRQSSYARPGGQSSFFLVALVLGVHDPAVQRLFHLWIEFQALVEIGFCFGVLLLIQPQDSTAGVCLGGLRVEFDDFAVIVRRRFKLALPLPGLRPVIIAVAVARVYRQRLRVVGDRAVKIVRREANRGAVVQAFEELRLQLQAFVVIGQGLGVLAERLIGEASRVVT